MLKLLKQISIFYSRNGLIRINVYPPSVFLGVFKIKQFTQSSVVDWYNTLRVKVTLFYNLSQVVDQVWRSGFLKCF